eukprot:500962_1
MATSFTLINLVTYAIIRVANTQWTLVWDDPFEDQGDWTCHVSHEDDGSIMSDTAWIEMSLSLSSLCDGASCAGWPLRLIVYVDAVNHDSDRYDPDIQMDAPFGLHIYDNGNWSRDWVCGDYWNNPF